VLISDCGYTTFNPGSAKCLGECRREWQLGYVADAWDAGEHWNRLQPFLVEKEELEKKMALLTEKINQKGKT
jgi:hypothetical protein